jgi:hypothetical protein
MTLQCLRRAPRLAARVQRAALSTAATKAPIRNWQTIYYRGIAACSVGAFAWLGHMCAAKFVETDAEHLLGKDLGQLIQAVSDCFSSGGAETCDGGQALFDVRSMCL